jgi:4-alpha-glucanotransferase
VALESFSRTLGTAIGEQKFMQWLFSRQWQALRDYCRDRGIRFFGDIPIFVAHDSADVWVERHLFILDAEGRPTVQAGVPPDYFSRTGQLWGNPLYEWDRHRSDGFGWWRRRIRSSLSLYDEVRIDHFRGFEACWQVPAGERTAVRGHWVRSPGRELFAALQQELGSLPLVAEDLGVITPEVEALRDEFGLPGMKILQFAFDSGPDNDYLPHNHRRNCVVYTGTHDNDTTVGWFASLGAKQRSSVITYLQTSSEEMPWPLIRAALASTARLSVIPLQDILELGSDARMNRPGNAVGNWCWRCPPRALSRTLARRIQGMVKMYGRLVK